MQTVTFDNKITFDDTVTFDHTKDNMIEAVNLDNIDMGIITDKCDEMINNFNRYDTHSEVVEYLYDFIKDNELPHIYVAMILFIIMDSAFHSGKRKEYKQ